MGGTLQCRSGRQLAAGTRRELSPQPRHLSDRKAGHEVVLDPADMRPSDNRRLRDGRECLEGASLRGHARRGL